MITAETDDLECHGRYLYLQSQSACTTGCFTNLCTEYSQLVKDESILKPLVGRHHLFQYHVYQIYRHTMFLRPSRVEWLPNTAVPTGNKADRNTVTLFS